MFLFYLTFLIFLPYGKSFQSMVNRKCKIPILNFLDLEIPTMTITISKEEKPKHPPKLCKHCIHYKPTLFKGEYEIGSHAATCAKFREMNLASGEYEYVNVMEARRSSKYCGQEGKHFESRVYRNPHYSYDDEENEENRKKE